MSTAFDQHRTQQSPPHHRPGVSKAWLARAMNVNLNSNNRHVNLLEGICPKAVTLQQDKTSTPDATHILSNTKAARRAD